MCKLWFRIFFTSKTNIEPYPKISADDASWRSLGILLMARKEWNSIELIEYMQLIGSEFEMLEFVEVEQDIPLSEAEPDLPVPELTRERAAWESFRMFIFTKEEWKTRELYDQRSIIEIEFQIGTIGRMMSTMGLET